MFGGIMGFASVFGINIFNTSPFGKNRSPNLTFATLPFPPQAIKAQHPCGFRFKA